MGWGQPHVISTGTTEQIALAAEALASVGITGDNLALGATEAAGVIVRLREDWAAFAAEREPV